MITTPIPTSFFFFLVPRFGTGLSTRVVIVVRVLFDVSAIAFVLLLAFLRLHQRRIDGRVSTSGDGHCPLPRRQILLLD